MIKIIKGPDQQYRITCKRCGTIFECDDSDFHEEIAGHGMTDYVVYCPTCHKVCSEMLSSQFCIVSPINRYEDRHLDERDIPPVNYHGGPSGDWF